MNEINPECQEWCRCGAMLGVTRNAVYYGMNLRFALLREDPDILNTLLNVLARIEEARPAKEKNKHI